MRRTLLIAFLALSVLFQALASAAPGLGVNAAEGLAHAVLHWEKVSHHHHDGDGAVHEDDSDESSRHLLADIALNVVALPSSAQVAPPAAAAPRIASGSTREIPRPVLDGPPRPPRIAG
jgi:hypothetical protein